VSTIDIHREAATERLLEDSWQTRSRRLPRREPAAGEAIAAWSAVADGVHAGQSGLSMGRPCL
jgi:hypothetical protein